MRQSVTDRDDDVRAIQEATEEREETERPSASAAHCTWFDLPQETVESDGTLYLQRSFGTDAGRWGPVSDNSIDRLLGLCIALSLAPDHYRSCAVERY